MNPKILEMNIYCHWQHIKLNLEDTIMYIIEDIDSDYYGNEYLSILQHYRNEIDISTLLTQNVINAFSNQFVNFHNNVLDYIENMDDDDPEDEIHYMNCFEDNNSNGLMYWIFVENYKMIFDPNIELIDKVKFILNDMIEDMGSLYYYDDLFMDEYEEICEYEDSYCKEQILTLYRFINNIEKNKAMHKLKFRHIFKQLKLHPKIVNDFLKDHSFEEFDAIYQ